MNQSKFKKEYDVAILRIEAHVNTPFSVSVMVTEKSTGKWDVYGWDPSMGTMYGAEPYFATFSDEWGSSEDFDIVVGRWIIKNFYPSSDLFPMAEPSQVEKFKKLKEYE
jgi:hypothetical protein